MSEVEIKSLATQWLLWQLLSAFACGADQPREILMPFAIGALIAYLGDPLVDRLEDAGSRAPMAS